MPAPNSIKPSFTLIQLIRTPLLNLIRSSHGQCSHLSIERAAPERKLPVVWTREEVQAVLGKMSGTHRLAATLLYGCGCESLAPADQGHQFQLPANCSARRQRRDRRISSRFLITRP